MFDATKEPISRVEWVQAETLRCNTYNPNMVMSAELRLLERSLQKTGWVQPIMVSTTGTIIDGFHRWRLSLESAVLQKKYGGQVPIVRMAMDEPQAMVHTIRMTRAKGSHGALAMSAIVKALVDEHDMDPQQVALEIGATRDEIDLLYQDGIFKHRNLKDYQYSKAWVPGESNAFAEKKAKR